MPNYLLITTSDADRPNAYICAAPDEENVQRRASAPHHRITIFALEPDHAQTPNEIGMRLREVTSCASTDPFMNICRYARFFLRDVDKTRAHELVKIASDLFAAAIEGPTQIDDEQLTLSDETTETPS